jgi:hypothetical protein
MVVEGQRPAAYERVRRVAMVDLDPYLAPEKHDPKREASDRPGQPRAEAQPIAVMAHAAQSLHGREPGARERAHVNAIPDVVLEVVQVHQRRLAEVGMGQLEVAYLCRDDRLRARRER